ncbi:MAG: fatty acid desaturase [Planctomycetes bacterium]|nr:fatty acid desaturase [Planctomycetota bacterium]
MAISQLPRPRSRKLALAVVGYPLVSLAPVLLSWGLLALISAQRAEPLPLLWLVLGLFAVRHFNVFIVSTLHHKSMAHQAFRFHPALERALRIWGWLFVGTGVRAFATLHRYHHAKTDTPEDPHSPTKAGESLWTVPAQTHRSYLHVLHHPEAYARYAENLPADRLEAFIAWDERHGFGFRGVRAPLLAALGIGLFASLFGPGAGVAVFFAALPATLGGVFATSVFTVNGLCHLIGYQTFESEHTATNLFPVDLLGWGEVLHQNHHMSASSANFAYHAWEWDPGYSVLWLLAKLGLVRDLKTPRPAVVTAG